jgi:hypothetical protein
MPVFLKMDGIKGESTDSRHREGQGPTSMVSGSGSTATGRRALNDAGRGSRRCSAGGARTPRRCSGRLVARLRIGIDRGVST